MKNNYIVNGGKAKIIIDSPKFGLFEATIDECDIEKCKDIKWCMMKIYHTDYDMYYVRGNLNGKQVLLHRHIMGVVDRSIIVDHIDGNGINNTRDNLRIVTHQQNSINRRHDNKDSESGYRGVYWDTHIKTPKWMAYITLGGKRKHIGYFDDLDEAIAARKEAEVEYFGEFNR